LLHLLTAASGTNATYGPRRPMSAVGSRTDSTADVAFWAVHDPEAIIRRVRFSGYSDEPLLFSYGNGLRRCELAVSSETWPHILGELVCARAGRKVAKIFAVATHQINESRVVDGVFRPVVPFDFFVIHPVSTRHRSDRNRIAGKADEARVKQRGISPWRRLRTG
jgi:hypothetical protein